MNDLRDFSKLPDDPAYWSALEASVLRSAGRPSIRAHASWTDVLARRAWGLGALATAAIIAAVLLVPPPPATRDDAAALALIGPPADNPAVVRFVASPAPPSVVELLVSPGAGRAR